MRARLEEFSLSLHPDKTRLIEFGGFAADRRARRGLGKPETFNVLGFTFICERTNQGKFFIMRKTGRDRMRRNFVCPFQIACSTAPREQGAVVSDARTREVGNPALGKGGATKRRRRGSRRTAFLPDTVIVSDNAGQFNIGQHGLCWVHSVRLVHKLDTFTDEKPRRLGHRPRDDLGPLP
jgi:hypothetical protein